jgi:hypothetical protein
MFLDVILQKYYFPEHTLTNKIFKKMLAFTSYNIHQLLCVLSTSLNYMHFIKINVLITLISVNEMKYTLKVTFNSSSYRLKHVSAKLDVIQTFHNHLMNKNKYVLCFINKWKISKCKHTFPLSSNKKYELDIENKRISRVQNDKWCRRGSIEPVHVRYLNLVFVFVFVGAAAAFDVVCSYVYLMERQMLSVMSTFWYVSISIYFITVNVISW